MTLITDPLEIELKKVGGYSWPTICRSCPAIVGFPFNDVDPGLCCSEGREELLVQIIVQRSLGVDITDGAPPPRGMRKR